MNIGELARQTGIAPSAIRFYERSGLLPAAARGANGYRRYSQEALDRLKVIGIGQSLGFSLDAMRDVLALEGEALQEGLLAGMYRRLADIDAMVQTLAFQRASLLETMAHLRDTPLTPGCSYPVAPAARKLRAR